MTGTRRGRPPRYGRQQIVEAVADALLTDPTTPLTMARAAEAAGAAPMSLYRHFADRDDLLQAVAQHVFASTRPEVDGDVPWQEQVRAWMVAVLEQAMRVPQLIELVATGESPAWVADSAYLAQALARAGIDDDRFLAEAVYWVASTTMGHAMIRAAGPTTPETDRWKAAVSRLDERDAERVERLLPHLEALHDEGFDLVVGWTIAGLERLISDGSSRSSGSGSAPAGRGTSSRGPRSRTAGRPRSSSAGS